MNKNPFTLMYGITSKSVIARYESIETIIKSFTEQESMFTYLITGIRGSGKTVLLRTLEKELTERVDWVVININPQTNIVSSLANKLFNIDFVKKELNKWSLSINLGVISLTRDNGDRIDDPEIIIETILKKIKHLNIKVLISIDEVNDTKEFREFINLYQILIGKDLDLYLLMTALKENVSGLINDKAMTFLSRTPKVELEPLSLPSITKEYAGIFNIDLEMAIEMAKLTKGYAFAYQVLGYLFYEEKDKVLSEQIIEKYEQYLWNNGYNKFWKDLTQNEKDFLVALSETNTGDKNEIISRMKMKKSNYPIYRERLLEKGLIYVPKYGTLDFVLPRFKEYVILIKEFE